MGGPPLCEPRIHAAFSTAQFVSAAYSAAHAGSSTMLKRCVRLLSRLSGGTSEHLLRSKNKWVLLGRHENKKPKILPCVGGGEERPQD